MQRCGKNFKIVSDEDGIIVYDESDDLDPGEVQILDEDDELDTDYLLRETARQAKRQQTQRWISVAVIIAVVSFIAAVSYINFRGIL